MNFRNPYHLIISMGVLIEIYLLIFTDSKISSYGPVIFALIEMAILINHFICYQKLSLSVKKSKPELFKKYSIFGFFDKHAVGKKDFINSLDANELEIIERDKKLIWLFVINFVLFGISGFLSVVKAIISG